MVTRELWAEEKENFNKLVAHPLQSWEWGEFREKTGIKIVRLGAFEGKKLTTAYQVMIHPLPYTNYSILYFPKGPAPDPSAGRSTLRDESSGHSTVSSDRIGSDSKSSGQAMLDALTKLGQQEKAIFVKMEPQVEELSGETVKKFLLSSGCQPGKPLFTKYTFQIDLQKSEEELMAQMKEKTRYNVRLAQKNGVVIKEDNSPEAFETYLRLTAETTQRQKFYAHSEGYHRLMWETLKSQKSKVKSQKLDQPDNKLTAHLLVASYPKPYTLNPIPLAAWIVFIFNKVLYYPYGASSSEHRELMASNLMMWEAMRFGKKMGCQTFDLWGALGPNPDPKDPWYGFHRFKEGYGGELVEFIGTYDFVLNPTLYRLYNLADNLRWKFLRFKSRLNGHP